MEPDVSYWPVELVNYTEALWLNSILMQIFNL